MKRDAATTVDTTGDLSEPSTSRYTEAMDDTPFRQRMGHTMSNDQNSNEMKQHGTDCDAYANAITIATTDSASSSGDDKAKRLTEIEMKTMGMVQAARPKQNIGANPDEIADGEIKQQHCGCIQIPIEHAELVDEDKRMARDVSSLKKKTNSLFFFYSILFRSISV